MKLFSSIMARVASFEVKLLQLQIMPTLLCRMALAIVIGTCQDVAISVSRKLVVGLGLDTFFFANQWAL